MKPNRVIHAKMSHSSNANHIKSPKSFSQKEVDLTQTPLFFPEGFEKIFLAIYFVTLPYIAGLLFIFLYVSERKFEVFLSLNKNSSFILTWSIGYEVIAGLTLLWIIKMALGFANESRKPPKKEFRRP
mgnify:CR=1 FL=1